MVAYLVTLMLSMLLGVQSFRFANKFGRCSLVNTRLYADAIPGKFLSILHPLVYTQHYKIFNLLCDQVANKP